MIETARQRGIWTDSETVRHTCTRVDAGREAYLTGSETKAEREEECGFSIEPALLHVVDSIISPVDVPSLPLLISLPASVLSPAATKSFVELSRSFGAGQMYPYSIVIVPPNGTAALSNATFTFAHDVAHSLVSLPGFK